MHKNADVWESKITCLYSLIVFQIDSLVLHGFVSPNVSFPVTLPVYRKQCTAQAW